MAIGHAMGELAPESGPCRDAGHAPAVRRVFDADADADQPDRLSDDGCTLPRRIAAALVPSLPATLRRVARALRRRP